MLEQNPVNEQRSDVLLFPMKLQEERWHAWKITLLLTHRNRQQSPALLRFFAFFFISYFLNPPCFPWTSWREWSSSSAIRTPSCEFLGKTWGHWWSVVTQTDTKKGRRETFFFFFSAGALPNNNTLDMNKRKNDEGGAVHLNDGEEGLCVILRVLQDVTWVGTTEARVD